MRKKDEEVIEKVVNKIIDSKVLLTGDGDFCVSEYMGEIATLSIRNLFSPESSIGEIAIVLYGSSFRFNREEVVSAFHEVAVSAYCFSLYGNADDVRPSFEVRHSDLEKSPSFKRLVDYVEENKHIILHNDKEYGKSHTLTDVDFI